MKIFLINNLYTPYNRGGAEQVTQAIAQGLKEHGHKVLIITTRPRFARKPNKSSQEKIYRLPSLFFDLNKIPTFFRIFWHFLDIFDFLNYFKIKKILHKEKCDLVITNNLKGLSYLIPRLIRKLKIKHYHILHDIQLIHPSGLLRYGQEKKLNSFLTKIHAKLCTKLFASPDLIISPSRWLLDLHHNFKFFPQSRKITQNNPLNTNFFRKQNKIKKNKIFTLLYVGQVTEHKGVLFLIQVFRKYFKNREINLEIIGNGDDLEIAKKLSTNLENIKFLGKLSHQKVQEKMQEVHALIVPSLCYENSPTVIYEAASLGLPIIASNLGGIPELINKFGGYLFTPHNEKDLKEKIENLIKKEKHTIENVSLDSEIKNLEIENYLRKIGL